MLRRVSDLRCSEKIIFGRYGTSNDIEEIKWIKMNDDDTIFLSESVLGEISFFRRECDDNSAYDYCDSNIDRFLNSRDKKLLFTDTIYNKLYAYNDCESGFLSNFSEWEYNHIDDTAVENDEFAGRLLVRKVFLPSYREIWSFDRWQFFRNGGTTKCLDKIGRPVSWWLRSIDYDNKAECIGRLGNWNYDDAVCTIKGIRPALNLKSDTPISEKDEYGYYHIDLLDVQAPESENVS